MEERTFESLGVPPTTIRAVDAVVKSRRGVVAVAGKSDDVVMGLEALCNLGSLRETSVAVMSHSGYVGPERVVRLGLADKEDYSWAQCFRDAMAVGFGAVVLGEIAGLDVGCALFEEWADGPFNAVGVHVGNATRVPTRLYDADLTVDQVTNRLAGVLSVRLAPRLCQECRDDRAPTPSERAAIERVGQVPPRVSDAVGCTACEYSGSRAQVAVTEWMEVIPVLRDLLGEDQTILREAAFPGGIGALPSDGLRLVDEGLLSVREWMGLLDSFY